MTTSTDGSDRSVGRRPPQPHSDFRVARAFDQAERRHEPADAGREVLAAHEKESVDDDR